MISKSEFFERVKGALSSSTPNTESSGLHIAPLNPALMSDVAGGYGTNFHLGYQDNGFWEYNDFFDDGFQDTYSDFYYDIV